jgi:hypothetical protein
MRAERISTDLRAQLMSAKAVLAVQIGGNVRPPVPIADQAA